MRAPSLTLVASAVALLASCPLLAQIPSPPDVAAPAADAQRTASGLASRVLQPGTGAEHPLPQSLVLVHYTGWTTDGRMFDSSVARGQAARLPLDSVIQGWTEGLQLMVTGERRRLWIPEDLAYQGQPNKPAGMLVFDVELLEIDNSLIPPPDVAAPPPDATVSKSGLAYKVLHPGEGSTRPTRDSVVSVRYSGWTTAGTLFESTAIAGRPSILPLSRVIKGWSEALTDMVQGERRRLWIPEKLAYEGEPGKPQGTLVFDVELVRIELMVEQR